MAEEKDLSIKISVGICFALVMILGLVFNGILFFVYCKRKPLRHPTKLFLVSLAVVDFVSIIFWTSFSTISAFLGEWILPTHICQLQEFAMSFCLLLNMHTFMILALERCLFLLKPSRHSTMCIDVIIIILLVSIWLFDGNISIFPFVGWGEISYFEDQFQCSMDYEKNTRQMRFATAIALGIPFLVMLVAYIIIFIKLRKLKKSVSRGGQIILEQADFANGDSYGARLKRQQLKFQNAGMKSKKPVLGREVDQDGYVRDNSSDEETKVSKTDKSKVQNIFYLYKSDVTLIKTYLMVTVVFLLLWLPYVIVTYILTHDRYHGIPDAVFYFVVILIHCTSFVKPLIYVIQNENFRGHLAKAFKKDKYRDFVRN